MQLVKSTGIARTQLYPRLLALEKKGVVTKTGRGVKGHPFTYALAKRNGTKHHGNGSTSLELPRFGGG